MGLPVFGIFINGRTPRDVLDFSPKAVQLLLSVHLDQSPTCKSLLGKKGSCSEAYKLFQAIRVSFSK